MAFYIRDLHQRSTLRLNPAAVVTVLAWNAEGDFVPRAIDLDAFLVALPDGPASRKWTVSGYYWFAVDSGVIEAIEVQDTP